MSATMEKKKDLVEVEVEELEVDYCLQKSQFVRLLPA